MEEEDVANDSNNIHSSQLYIEVEAVEREFKSFVHSLVRSEKLPQSSSKFYVNLKTLEDQTACIELTVQGWRICSLDFDSVHGGSGPLPGRHFETMSQLLDTISPKYRDFFAECLNTALLNLRQKRQFEEE